MQNVARIGSKAHAYYQRHNRMQTAPHPIPAAGIGYRPE